MNLKIGTVRNNFNGYSSIARIASDTKNLLIDDIVLDFSNCTFFEANMVAPLQTVLAGLFDRLNDVTLINFREATEKILRKNRFLTFFNRTPLIDSNQTTLPFKKFKIHADEQFSEYLERYMIGRGIPYMTNALKKKFNQSLFEIFQNSAIHSESDSGIFVCGQFYPQKSKLDFSISDAGVGIRENVRRHLKNENINSVRALKWAMIEGNSTKRSGQPGGLGLKLIKDFITINGGKLHIVSRRGFYEFCDGSETINKMEYDFPGTCVNIEINTNDNNTYSLLSELTVADIF